MKIGIRVAKIEDLPAIVGIYNQAVPTHRSTANTTPVTVEARKKWFDEHEPDRHPIFVAELDGCVIGWCSLSVYRPGRAALRFTAEISYYVDTSHQGQGVGQALIRHAVEASPRLGSGTSSQSSWTATSPAENYWRNWAFNSGVICRVSSISTARNVGSSITGNELSIKARLKGHSASRERNTVKR